jgi:hypothetical protein
MWGSVVLRGAHKSIPKKQKKAAQPLRADRLGSARLNAPAPTAQLGSTSHPGRLVPARLRLAPACGAAATLVHCIKLLLETLIYCIILLLLLKSHLLF